MEESFLLTMWAMRFQPRRDAPLRTPSKGCQAGSGVGQGWLPAHPCPPLAFGKITLPFSLVWGTQYQTAMWALISRAQGITGPHVATLPC